MLSVLVLLLYNLRPVVKLLWVSVSHWQQRLPSFSFKVQIAKTIKCIIWFLSQLLLLALLYKIPIQYKMKWYVCVQTTL